MSALNDITREIEVLRGNKTMTDKILYRVRKFINQKGNHSTALLFVEFWKHVNRGSINKKTKKRRKDHIWYDAELKISDCDRIINLSIDCHNRRSVKNTLYKLDLLINTLKEFRNIFAKEMNLHFKSKKR